MIIRLDFHSLNTTLIIQVSSIRSLSMIWNIVCSDNTMSVCIISYSTVTLCTMVNHCEKVGTRLGIFLWEIITVKGLGTSLWHIAMGDHSG
jgi:hypothetical protein